MIAENRSEFEKAGILNYHQAGILGQGIRIAILDVTKDDHYAQVMRLRDEAAPLADIEFFHAGYKKESVDAIMAGKFDIINCSFSSVADSEFERLEALDIPVICAAGNNCKDYISYPASLPWTIAVGAWKEQYDKLADYSQQGADLDCVAYTDLYINNSRGDGVAPFGGTSASAPMVTYMLALCMSAFGKLNREQARRFIHTNCIDKLETGHDPKSGYGLFVLPRLEVPTMADIKLLHPDLQPKAQKLIELAKAKGIDIVISQTLRTEDEQQALYAQGRTKPGNIVTRVTYPYSLHCWGVAFDVAVIINKQASWIAAHFDVVGPIGESLGLKWGGRWQNFPDKPHFELPGYNTSELVKKYGTPENFIKTWKDEPVKEAKKVAGFEGPAKVVFRGKELSAGILEGKTFVELRALAELLGLKVYWDAATKTVTLS
jgi:peptidoglycan L-alanyl-D-glutamate endopeptidase CwlK